MKKILSLFLVLALAFALCSCTMQDILDMINAKASAPTSTPCEDMLHSTEAPKDPAKLEKISSYTVYRTNDEKAYLVENNEWVTIELEGGFLWDEEVYEPYTAIVTSEDGITETISRYCSYAEDVLAQFDEEFFKENAVIFYGTGDSCSSYMPIALSVGEIEKGESLEIEVGRRYMAPDSPVTEDVLSWTFIFIVDRDAVDGTETITEKRYEIHLN
ncbi:MAG: hypothetical protein IJX55_06645 [Clostridia bacterium]|nr:hypothetical protein [Clostridia bacterium]